MACDPSPDVPPDVPLEAADPEVRTCLAGELMLLTSSIAPIAELTADLLTDDYSEFGASGRSFDRPLVLSRLGPNLKDIEPSRLRGHRLADDVVLVRYDAVRGSVASRRSSLWVRRAGRWRMRHNQGTWTVPPDPSLRPRMPSADLATSVRVGAWSGDPDLSACVAGELALHDPAVRRQPAVTEALLHPEFDEVGSSGRELSRDVIVAAMAVESDEASIVTADLLADRLAPSVVFLRYASARDGSAQWANRASVWVRGALGWQMRFHHGTPAIRP